MTITFKADIWVYDGPGAWYFITLPKDVSREIHASHAHLKRGWGSLPVTAKLGSTTWKTSLFPDSKIGSFLLPVKKLVRAAEGIGDGSKVTVELVIGGSAASK